MKILHLSNSFFPDVVGGTEVFVWRLIHSQTSIYSPLHFEALWASHSIDSDSLFELSYPFQRRLPPLPPVSRSLSASASAPEIPGFLDLLTEFSPEVVHLHSFSNRCGLSHARAVKQFGARLVVTVHAPGFSCFKGNLIDASGAICDGKLRERRCTRCRLNNGGLPRWLAGAVALQNGWPLSAEIPGVFAHVLTARQLTTAFQRAWLEVVELADAIHVLAAWSQDVLLRQGIPSQ